MIDRRLIGLLVVVVVSVLAGRSAMSGTPAPPAESAVSFEPALVTAPTAAAAGTSSTDAVEDVITTSTMGPFRTAAPATTIVEVVELVDARRPTIAVLKTPGHDHVDDGEQEPTGDLLPATVTQTAADLVIAGWTWRFDDTDTRQLDALALLAEAAVVDALAPVPADRQRRLDAWEVSWVIVRDISVDGTRSTVRFDQHVVTSLSAETVTARSVTITIVAGVVVDVEVAL